MLAPTGLLLAVVEGGEAKNPLIPNANELFWGTICFAIFVSFMVKFVLPKAKEALDAIVTRGNEQLERFQKANKG